jgi:hypothetical protein
VAEKSKEHFMEAPYLVTDTRRKGWSVKCSCGFRPPLFETKEEALAAAQEHFDAEEKLEAEPKGFFARRKAKKAQRADWEERRR